MWQQVCNFIPARLEAHMRADREAIADANRLNQAETGSGVENTELIGQLLDKINDDVAEPDAIML